MDLKPSTLSRAVVGAVVLLLLCHPTSAQERPAKLPVNVIVELVAPAEKKINGLLIDLGPESAAVVVGNDRRMFPLDGVLSIRTRGDSVKNGAIIGAVIGGVWCSIVCGQGLDNSSQVPLAVAINAGVFALIGAGIDASISGHTTIYRRPSGRTTASRPALSFNWRF